MATKTVREYRKIIGSIADNDESMYGMLTGSLKLKSNFALGGAAILFLYAISRQKQWFPYTLMGLILGAGLGWLVEEIKAELHGEKDRE
jgi:lipoprotein signal peptidase